MNKSSLSLYNYVFIIVAIVVITYVADALGYVYARKRGYSQLGKNTIVRCSKRHLFTTTWMPAGSIKAVRLGGMKRYQICPVCHHWRLVVPLKDVEINDAVKREAGKFRSGLMP